MKSLLVLVIACCFLLPPLTGLPSLAWGGCTVEQRITLGSQGYDKDQVDEACGNDENSFWGIVGRGVEMAIHKGLDKALGGNGQSPAGASTFTGGASACATNYGTCPLQGGPINAPCYCTSVFGYVPGSSR